MNLEDQYLVFTLDEKRYAMGISRVEKVIRAVEINTVPDDKNRLLGLINMQGRIIPVINIRRFLFMPDRELDINDRIIISCAMDVTAAFVVDRVEGVIEIPQSHVERAEKIFPRLGENIDGVGKLKEDTLLIYGMDNLISPQDLDRVRGISEKSH